MLNRALVVAENFLRNVKEQHFPALQSETTPLAANLDKAACIDIFSSQIISRLLDLKSRQLKDQQLTFYTIGSSGHEGNAAIAKALHLKDMVFLHYRSGAFMAQRLKQLPDLDVIYDLMLSFVAAKCDPASGGRHKVFGSLAANVPPQTSTIASHLPKAVGAAFSINLAKALKFHGKLSEDAIILASFGDASFNHSVAQGALNAATWIHYAGVPLPLIFVCEDNGIGISVPTPSHWIRDRMQDQVCWHYLTCDGLNFADTYQTAQQAVKIARLQKKPVFLHMRCVRLLGHAGSDVEQQYHDLTSIEANEFNDPLLHSAHILIQNNLLNAQEIIELYQYYQNAVNQAATKALQAPTLKTAVDVMQAIIPKSNSKLKANKITQALREKTFGSEYRYLQQKRNLCQLINYALTDLMLQYDNIVLLGEDIAKKGGVYRVTADLMQRFGKKRVFDTLLDETTILGQAIGLAHNGFLAIPEIQFLAYYHNAQDQIRGEAATLSFFSNQQFTNPMVIRIAGLAYQKGFGGHFHNDNSLAALRDLPGVIIACPSNGADAVKLLRHCVYLANVESRIVFFIEPIALYMTKDLHEFGDQVWLSEYPHLNQEIKLGEITSFGKGDDITIITYGNGYYLSRQAEKILREKDNIKSNVIDLHWLAPLPAKALIKAVKKSKRILIVDETRQTGSISEAIIALLVENLKDIPYIKRLTALDSFIPTGNSWQSVVPSVEKIIVTATEMVKGDKA